MLAWWRQPSPVDAVDRAEVARAVRVPVAELVDPANRFLVTHPSGYVGAGFGVRGLFVWGFTAGILDRVLALAGWERPWNRDRLEPLPAPVQMSEVRLEDTLVQEPIAGDVWLDCDRHHPAGGRRLVRRLRVPEGLAVGALSLGGFLVGALLAMTIVPPMAAGLQQGIQRSFIVLVCVLLFAWLGQLGGDPRRAAATEPHPPPPRWPTSCSGWSRAWLPSSSCCGSSAVRCGPVRPRT